MISCVTDMGRSREINEDNCSESKVGHNWHLLIVADGMGGHNAGEVASKIAVNSITEYMNENIKDSLDSDFIIKLIKESIQKANTDIYEESIKNTNCSGMGTTVTMAMMFENIVLIGHVGDSRAYVYKKSKLTRVTNDHSLVAELVKNGTITEMEAQHHPQKNIITRALGAYDNVEIDIEQIIIAEKDIVMLCTDGLTNMISDEEIEEILFETDDLNSSAKKMVNRANELGGYDNITVILAKTDSPDSEVKQ